jgi:hypothetical protein
LRRLRIALATGWFSVGEGAFSLKSAVKPSQGFPPSERMPTFYLLNHAETGDGNKQ